MHQLGAELSLLVIDLGGHPRVFDRRGERVVDRAVQLRGEPMDIQGLDRDAEGGVVVSRHLGRGRGECERVGGEGEQGAAVLRRGGAEPRGGGEGGAVHRAEALEVFREHLLRRDGPFAQQRLAAQIARGAEHDGDQQHGGDQAAGALFLFLLFHGRVAVSGAHGVFSLR